MRLDASRVHGLGEIVKGIAGLGLGSFYCATSRRPISMNGMNCPLEALDSTPGNLNLPSHHRDRRNVKTCVPTSPAIPLAADASES